MWTRTHLDVANVMVPGVQRSRPALGDLDRPSLSLDVPNLTSFLVHVGHAFGNVLITCSQAPLPSLGLSWRQKIDVERRWHHQPRRDVTLIVWHFKAAKWAGDIKLFYKASCVYKLNFGIEFGCFHWENMLTDTLSQKQEQESRQECLQNADSLNLIFPLLLDIKL